MQQNPVRRTPPGDLCCAGASTDVIPAPAGAMVTDMTETSSGSLYSRCGKVGKVMYTVGAVFAAPTWI